jgi:hypothetical protein
LKYRDFYVKRMEELRESDPNYYKIEQFGNFVKEEQFSKGVTQLIPELINCMESLVTRHDEDYGNFLVTYIVKPEIGNHPATVGFKITHKDSKKVYDAFKEMLENEYKKECI